MTKSEWTKWDTFKEMVDKETLDKLDEISYAIDACDFYETTECLDSSGSIMCLAEEYLKMSDEEIMQEARKWK